MTIKEMEERSALQRANIRFYEQEGLIAPRRQSNGYRDYSEDDLQQLHRIHLLRTLGLSLDEIRSLQKGETALDDLLAQQAETLEQQASDAQQRAQLCRQIRRDGAQYSTLDGRHYLDTLAAGQPTAVAVPKADTYHKVTAPWRRFFARYFDLFLYSMVWILLGLALLREGPSSQAGSAWNGFASFMSVGMMLFLEPLFLSTWGTTPGKWLLGLSVRDNTGNKLTYGEGFYRTVQALWSGLGFFVPIYSLIRLYHCYYDCVENKTAAWEWDSELQLKDEKVWRIGAMPGSVFALFGLLTLVFSSVANPTYHGDMTVAEFAENYNRLAKFHGYEFRLDENGRWTNKPRPDGSVVIHMGGVDTPHFVYNEQDGIMTGLTATIVVNGDIEKWIPIQHSRRILAILAFAQAYDPTPLNNDEVMAVIQKLESHPFDSLDETVHGVRIVWTFTSAGYHKIDNILVPIEGQTPSCTMTFSMEKVS